jgi:hypothetical protein
MMSARAGTLMPESLTLLGHARLGREAAVDRGRADRAPAMGASQRLRTMFRLQGVGYLLSRAGA